MKPNFYSRGLTLLQKVFDTVDTKESLFIQRNVALLSYNDTENESCLRNNTMKILQ